MLNKKEGVFHRQQLDEAVEVEARVEPAGAVGQLSQCGNQKEDKVLVHLEQLVLCSSQASPGSGRQHIGCPDEVVGQPAL